MLVPLEKASSSQKASKLEEHVGGMWVKASRAERNKKN